MPHIDIKCYPKGLSKQELQSFADDLTTFASKRLNTPKEYIIIAYTEVPWVRSPKMPCTETR